MKSQSKLEILAPAGSPESIYAAVRNGADAVYVGGERFSARANAVNFTSDELEKAVDYCHLHNVRVYQAVNTLFFDNELKPLLETVGNSVKIGVDAFIVQDLGAAYMLKQTYPEIKLNASTQMTVHTREGAEFAREAGFSRVVVSRELTLEQIKNVCGADIEVEAFVHGALCMSVSGQCYMSAMIGSRSANRGQCAQACRLPFSAIEGSERHDLSLKDMCQISYISALKEAGVTSLKIEGRMKRAEYVAAAVSACRAAADGKEPDLETLKAVFSRSGFTDGYLTGKTGAEMFGIRQKEDVVSAEKVLAPLRESFRKETKAVGASFHAVIKENEPTVLEMQSDGEKVTVSGEAPQKALNRPTDLPSLEKQLSKLGDTPYELEKITADIDDGLILPASQLNSLRRGAVEKMDNARLSGKRKRLEFYPDKISLDFPKTLEIKKKSIRVSIRKIAQLDGVPEYAEMIFIPLAEVEKNLEKCLEDKRIAVAPPRFTDNEERLENRLAALKKAGLDKLLCANVSHLRIGKKLGMELYGDFGLNVTNSLTLKTLAEYGVKDVTASFEMKLSQINTLGGFLPCGIIAYGALPLMLTRNCPIKQAVGGCKSCTGFLTDRTGRKFPVRCDGTSSEILNCDVLLMNERLNEVNTAFIRLDFNNEAAEDVKRITGCYFYGRKLDLPSFTRGLYYRGIL